MHRIWIHDERTDGARPVSAQIEKYGEFIHVRFAGVHIAIKTEELEDIMEQGDDRK